MPRVDKPVRMIGSLNPRWTPAYLSGLTTATSRDPRPGSAVTESTLPRLDPAIVGAQERTVVIEVLQGGYPQLGGTSLGVGYYLADETIADARGVIIPTCVTDHRRTAGMESETALRADCAFDPVSGEVFTLVGELGSRYNPSGSLSDVALPASLDYSGIAVACYPDTGRLVLAGLDDVRVSDDHGVTWTKVAGGTRDYASGSPTWVVAAPETPYRLVVDGFGSLMWMGYEDVGGSDTAIRLMASDDGGASWDDVAVTYTPAASTVQHADMSAHPEGWIAWVEVVGGGEVVFRLLDNAWTDPEDVDPVTVVDEGSGGHDMVMCCCDTNGVVWVYATWNNGGVLTTTAYYSVDRGDTWITSDVLVTDAAPEIPTGKIVPHPHGGLFGAWRWGLGTGDNSIVQLGAWTAPGRVGGDWPVAYLGWADPTGYGWAHTGAGTTAQGTAGAIRGYWEHDATVGGLQSYHSITVSGASADDGSVEAIIVCPEVDVSVAQAVGIKLRMRVAATTQRTIAVYVEPDGYRVRDLEAGAWVAAKVLVDLTARTHLRLSVNGATGYVAHRADNETLWTVQTLSGMTTSATGSAGSCTAYFGVLELGATEMVLRTWMLRTRATPANKLQGRDNLGIGATSYPCPELYDTARQRMSYLRIRGGPSIPGEVYTIAPSYGYPLEASFPTQEPSPSRPWRTGEGTSGDQDVLVDRGYDTDSGGAFAFAVRNCNVRHIDVIAMEDGGGSIDVLYSMDLADGFADLGFARTGERLTPVGTSIGSRYLRRNELAGSTAILADSFGTVNSYKIHANTAGWFDAAASVVALVYITDPVGAPTAGEVSLVFSDALLVAYRATPVAYRYIGWRVKDGTPPNANYPADNYYQIGCAYLFQLAAFGKQWSNGQQWTWTPNVRAIVDEAGTQRRKQLGPTVRSLALSWDDGARLARSIRRADGVDADWIGPTTVPLVGRDDVIGQLVGVIESAQGGALPVLVVLDDEPIGVGGAAVKQITDRSLWLIGYMDGEIQDIHTLADDMVDGGAEFARNAIPTIVEAV